MVQNSDSSIREDSSELQPITVIPPPTIHIDSPKWKNPNAPQYIASAVVAVGAFNFGNVLGWSSPALPSIEKSGHFPNLVTSDLSWIGSLTTIGAVVGAPLAGYFIDKIGRRNTLMWSALPLSLGWLGLSMAVHVTMLYIGRFLTGIGVGSLNIAVPVYLSEISQAETRGCLGTVFQVAVMLGILFTYGIGSLTPYNYLAGICSIVPIFFAVLVANLPESPRYLLTIGQTHKATDALCWLRVSDNKSPSQKVLKEIDEIQKAINRTQERKTTFSDIFFGPTKKPLMVVFGLTFFNQFSGVNAYGFYAVEIFEQSGVGLESYLSGVLVAGFQAFSTIIAFLYVDKAGRRILLMLSFIIMSLSLVTLGTFFYLKAKNSIFHESINWIPLISLILFNAAYIGGVGNLVWTVMSEVFPSNVKGFCTGLTTMFNWSLAFIITRFFHDLNEALGPQITFWLFAAFCAIGFAFTFFFVPETRGKSLERIHQENFDENVDPPSLPTTVSQL